MSTLNEEAEEVAWEVAEELTERIYGAGGEPVGESELWHRIRRSDQRFLTKSGLSPRDFFDYYAPELTVVDHVDGELVWGLGLAEDEPDIDAYTLTRVGEVASVEVEWLSTGFRNYRSLRSAAIELQPLTVLVGRNGAGKSNVLDGLFRASLLTRRKPAVVFSGPNDRSRIAGRWGPREGFAIGIRGSSDWAVRYDYRPARPDFDAERPFSSRTGGEVDRRASLLFTPQGQAFGGAVYLRLDARTLQRATTPPREEPVLRHDGLYLPSVLAHIVQTERVRFQAIIDHLRELVPAVEDMRTPWEEIDVDQGTAMGNRLEVKMRGVGWIPADQLSEGTLLALGLITVLSRPQTPRLILLDDIDRGLHPSAQRRLIEMLQTFASTKTKIVCSSHSPYIIDPLNAEQVRVVVADPDSGATTIHELAKHPEWPKWSKTMTPADFWQYVGDESWPGETSE